MTLWLAHGGYVAFVAVHALCLVALLAWRNVELRGLPWAPLPSRWRGAAAIGLGLVVVLIAAALRMALPASPQVLYDEFWYLSTARHIVTAGDATPFVQRGIPPVVPPGTEFRPPYPQGWPCLEAVFYQRGEAWRRGVTVQRAVGVAACLAMFAMLAAESLVAATVAGLGLAVLPAFLRLSQGASSEGASALFVILALWAARSQRMRPGTAGALLAVAACAWAMHFRPENFLYLGLFLPFAFVGRFDAAASRRWMIGAVLLLTCFGGMDLAIMADGARGPRRDDHFVAQPRPGFATWQANMGANLRENASFFVDGRVLPQWVTIAAIIGSVLIALGGSWKPLVFYWGWIALFTLLLSPFPFGDFASAHSLDTWRFSVQISLPLLLLAARAAEHATQRLARLPAVAVIGALALAAGLQTASFWSFATAPHPTTRTWDDLQTVASHVPTGALVLVNDDSIAVTLQEGFGLQTVWDDGRAIDGAAISAWNGALCMVEVTQADVPAAPSSWSQVSRRLLWTNGVIDPSVTGFTVYQRAAGR